MADGLSAEAQERLERRGAHTEIVEHEDSIELRVFIHRDVRTRRDRLVTAARLRAHLDDRADKLLEMLYPDEA